VSHARPLGLTKINQQINPPRHTAAHRDTPRLTATHRGSPRHTAAHRYAVVAVATANRRCSGDAPCHAWSAAGTRRLRRAAAASIGRSTC